MLSASDQSQTPVGTVPHQLLFRGWKSRLESIEISAIEMELDHLVGTTKSNEINTARWLPFDICAVGRHDWEGSPFVRIWEKACDRDRARTCWCFAIFLWEQMMRRPDGWRFKVMDLDGAPMAATKYYRQVVTSRQPTKSRAELAAEQSLA